MYYILNISNDIDDVKKGGYIREPESASNQSISHRRRLLHRYSGIDLSEMDMEEYLFGNTIRLLKRWKQRFIQCFHYVCRYTWKDIWEGLVTIIRLPITIMRGYESDEARQLRLISTKRTRQIDTMCADMRRVGAEFWTCFWYY
jgi:hypothetical protein